MLTNKLNLPAPFVDACDRERRFDDKTFSVTELLKGECEILLTRRHADEITQDVSDMVWLIFGTAVHSILERGRETDTQLKENRVYMDFPDGYRVTGRFDLYDDATGTVTDYKTASVWKVIYDEWEDYRKQLLCYCLLLRSMGFNAHRGEIVALLKDHSKSKAKRESGYPPYPVYIRKFEFTDEDFETCAQELVSKIVSIHDLEGVPDGELPPCTPEERWRKPSKYAVMKKGRKKALKLYDDPMDAEIHALEVGGYVEHRPGVDGKCADYCPVKEFCSYYKGAQDGIQEHEKL